MLPCVVSLLECSHRELVANLEDALCCLQLVVLWPSDSPLLLPPEPALHLSDLSAADAYRRTSSVLLFSPALEGAGSPDFRLCARE